MAAHGVVHGILGAILLALLVQTWLGARAMPRLHRIAPARGPRAAVLIPARNESSRIGDCVRAWTAQDHPDYEIVVLDDDSTDDTAARAAAAGGRVIRSRGLPAGWRGKPHACHRLRHSVRAGVLVFADADVLPAHDALGRALGALDALGVEAVSALPAHASASVAVRALVAVQNWAPLALVPLWLSAARRAPRFAILNGQFIAIRAHTYDAVGGFAAVRTAVGEDTALARRLVARGHRVALLDGTALLRCRPYTRPGEVWRANVRNLATAFFGSPLLLAFATVGALSLYVLPPALLAVGLLGARLPGWPWLPLIETALGVASRLLTDRRAGYPRWLALLHPVAMLGVAGMMADALWHLGRNVPIEWRGRRYGVDRAD